MSVTVTREPAEDIICREPWENCCFCRAPTPFWYFPNGAENQKPRDNNEVACCQGCSLYANSEDMPSKKEWMRRERIAHLGGKKP